MPRAVTLDAGLASYGPRVRGIVKFYKAEAGFGFIQSLDPDGTPSSTPDVFVHATQVPPPPPGQPALQHGQLVEFSEATVSGRRQAMGVSLLAAEEEAGWALPESLGGELGEEGLGPAAPGDLYETAATWLQDSGEAGEGGQPLDSWAGQLGRRSSLYGVSGLW